MIISIKVYNTLYGPMEYRFGMVSHNCTNFQLTVDLFLACAEHWWCCKIHNYGDQLFHPCSR